MVETETRALLEAAPIHCAKETSRNYEAEPAKLAGATRLGAILRARPQGAVKYLDLDTGQTLVGPRYLVAGKGGVLFRDGRGILQPLKNGSARILPAYRSSQLLMVGARQYRVLVKEIDESDELEAYSRLASLHYRSDRAFGRRAVLIVKTTDPELPRVLGYVEITTGFLMNQPRTRILNAPFSDGQTKWSEWRTTETRTLTSLVSRISRLVVHPELRGHGIGTMLVRDAARYSRTHFHAGGFRPLFLELTADMTKFVPFAERAGMHYVGETEGNLRRVGKDMRYLLGAGSRLTEPTSTLRARGILQAQRRYAATAATLVKRDGMTGFSDALSGLTGSLDPDVYEKLFGILRLPKPTYLMGLTPASDRFVQRRRDKLEVESPRTRAGGRLPTITAPILLADFSLSFDSQVERTERSTDVQEAFGIRPEAFRSLVVHKLSVTIPPGSITLMFGPSGTGKTTVLNLLAGVPAPSALRREGRLEMPLDARIGSFEALPRDKPLIEAIAADAKIEDAIYALNIAGLSDAKLYLRRFTELSNGQKYRAMLAFLIGSDANVWVADEFLSTLDPLTAASVASNIAKHVRSRGVTLIVGAPHFDTFIEAINPDLVVRLVSPWEHEVVEGPAFLRAWRGARACAAKGR
jgi:ABC-type transport system involved in cytochrome c biogenesis ATPase subunit/GNAT superfamily N-acetyltransferase